MVKQRIQTDAVQGYLHLPETKPIARMALTHGAGSHCEAPWLAAVADAFADQGYAVLRYDLPFRRARASGPPTGGKPGQARDRLGIQAAAAFLREQIPSDTDTTLPLYLAGHSYGGRQSSMLAADQPSVADALLLLSYPLHPPGAPEKRRTEHFPALALPCLFVHGTKDEFGTPDELLEARVLIPAQTELKLVQGAGHGFKPDQAPEIAAWFHAFVTGTRPA